MERYLNQIDKAIELYNKAKEQEAFEHIKQLRETIIFDIALKNSKNKYDREQLKSAKELLKSAQKDKSRILLHKMYKIDDTYQLCDGYIAVVLKEPIKGLELNIADGKYFDCRDVLKTANGNYFEFDNNYEKVQVDMLDLELKVAKAKKIKDVANPLELVGRFGETYYNSSYLLRAIKILGTKDVEIYADTSGARREIFLKSELGQSMVSGLTVSKEIKEEMQANQ